MQVVWKAWVLWVGMVGVAWAQTPADVTFPKVGEVYTVKAQMADDADTASLCCFRVDAPNEQDLGCTAAAASAIVTMDVSILRTENDDAEVRCLAMDTDGNQSAYSPNAGIVDFTNPQPPVLQ